VADDEVDVEGSGPPQKLGVEHVALDGDVFAIDREIEAYRLHALESTQALELLLVPREEAYGVSNLTGKVAELGFTYSYMEAGGLPGFSTRSRLAAPVDRVGPGPELALHEKGFGVEVRAARP